MGNNDLVKNFEFFYYGTGRHLCGDTQKYEKPLRVLLNLGGRETVSIDHRNDDIMEGLNRSANILFKVFEFSGQTRAYYYSEEYPGNSPAPKYCIRIRIANYKEKDGIGKKISEELKMIPKTLDSVVE